MQGTKMTETIPSLAADPCGRAEALRATRDLLITGGGVAEFDSEQVNGVRRRVKYTNADLPRRDQKIATAEKQCLLKSGKRGQQFAVSPRGGGW